MVILVFGLVGALPAADDLVNNGNFEAEPWLAGWEADAREPEGRISKGAGLAPDGGSSVILEDRTALFQNFRVAGGAFEFQFEFACESSGTAADKSFLRIGFRPEGVGQKSIYLRIQNQGGKGSLQVYRGKVGAAAAGGGEWVPLSARTIEPSKTLGGADGTAVNAYRVVIQGAGAGAYSVALFSLRDGKKIEELPGRDDFAEGFPFLGKKPDLAEILFSTALGARTAISRVTVVEAQP